MRTRLISVVVLAAVGVVAYDLIAGLSGPGEVVGATLLDREYAPPDGFKGGQDNQQFLVRVEHSYGTGAVVYDGPDWLKLREGTPLTIRVWRGPLSGIVLKLSFDGFGG